MTKYTYILEMSSNAINDVIEQLQKQLDRQPRGYISRWEGNLDMKKSDIKNLSNTELFVEYYDYVVKIVKETNSARGLSKKTYSLYEAITDECVERFGLDRDKLSEEDVI